MEIVCVITFIDGHTESTSVDILQVILNTPNFVEQVKRIEFYKEEV